MKVVILWSWIALAALLVGWMSSGMYHEYKCNEQVIINYHPEKACEFGLIPCNHTTEFFNESLNNIP